MKQGLVAILLLCFAQGSFADLMTRVNGEEIGGTFEGFEKHQLIFKKTDGSEVREFAFNVKSITVDPCPVVSVELINRRLDSAVFKGYEKHLVSLVDNVGETQQAPATMLKSITILEAPDVQDEARTQPVVKAPATPVGQIGKTVPGVATLVPPRPVNAGREWKQGGKWREMDSPGVAIISRGEDVDIESQLRRGLVNVIHFHYAAAHSSVRQGNYIEMLARKSNGRITVSRIVVPGWDAPICVKKELKALPQFWFYSRSGRLTKKLTDRFTESDIDAAMKQALQQL